MLNYSTHDKAVSMSSTNEGSNRENIKYENIYKVCDTFVSPFLCVDYQRFGSRAFGGEGEWSLVSVYTGA